MREDFAKRKEVLEKITKTIQDSQIQLPDIRERNWMNVDCPVSNLLKLLINIEDLLLKLDEYQMKNEQCYPEFEDFMLQIGDIRSKYTAFIDNNLETLDIKNI